jgi:hypothetical protein
LPDVGACRKDQKIAAFGSAYAPVGAAEGCDLLILLFISPV